jgi:hypothetical protein
MHGTIFAELKKYVDTKVGGNAWQQLLSATQLERRIYLPVESYPDEEAVKLVVAASTATGKPVDAILEDFGLFITPDLMRIYGALAKPEWKTLEFLENTESTIHRVVRMRDAKAQPPELKVTRSGPKEVTILYGSSRRLCALARGLVQGVARHYGEQARIDEPACQHKGAKICRLIVAVG